MKQYTANQIARFVTEKVDLEKVTLPYLRRRYLKLQRMLAFLEAQDNRRRQSFRLIKGGK